MVCRNFFFFWFVCYNASTAFRELTKPFYFIIMDNLGNDLLELLYSFHLFIAI